MKNRRTSFTSMGIPSLFLIFFVLCLVILSLLTLETSRSDLRNSKLSLEQTDSYYKACDSATTLCLEAEEYLQQLRSQSTSEEHYYSQIETITRKFPAITWERSSRLLLFDTTVSDSLTLHVELQAVYPEEADGSPAEILCWKTQTQGSWNPDTSQPVFKGEFK